MEDRDQTVIDKVESLCNTHGWTFDTASGGLPITLTSPDDEHEISVHGSPNPDATYLVVERMERGGDMFKHDDGDAIVKRVRLWLENLS